jgi:transposase
MLGWFIQSAVEVSEMSNDRRRETLLTAGLVHPRPDGVVASLFGSDPFFLAEDKVQVKYEMLRAHVVDGASVTDAARLHGYSRAEFYLVADAFSEAGMVGLLEKKRGRKGPLKVTEEIRGFVEGLGEISGAKAAARVQERFGVSLHRRTLERILSE